MSKSQMVPHPDLNALAAFIDQRLPEADRASVVSHLVECADCRALVAAHARGQMPLAHQDQHAAGRRASSLFRPAVWLPIAATLALATTAALIVSRGDRVAPSPTTPVVPEPSRPPVETPAQTVSPPPSTAAPPASEPGSLTTRRGGVRTINGKTFRLVAGEWIDSAFDPVALLPVQDIAGTEARAALIARLPALAPYAALGTKVTVVHDGYVYQFRP